MNKSNNPKDAQLIAIAPELFNSILDLIKTIEVADQKALKEANPAILEWAWSAKKLIKKIKE